jgi:PAS domain S-box-containing protein
MDTFMTKLGTHLATMGGDINVPRAAVGFIMNTFCHQLLEKERRWEHNKILNEDDDATTCVTATAAIVPHERLPRDRAPSISDFPTTSSPRTMRIAKALEAVDTEEILEIQGPVLQQELHKPQEPQLPKSCPTKYRSTRTGLPNGAGTAGTPRRSSRSIRFPAAKEAGGVRGERKERGDPRGDQRAMLHAMIENMAMADVMACTVDEQGRFDYVSARVTLMLAYQPQEMVSKRVGDYVHPNDVKAVQDLIGAMQSKSSGASISSTGTFKVRSPKGESQKLSERLQMRRKDGRFVWLEVKCKALDKGTTSPTKLLVFR